MAYEDGKSLEGRVAALEAENAKLQEEMDSWIILSAKNPNHAFLPPLAAFFRDADANFFETVPVGPELGGGDPETPPSCRKKCFLKFRVALQAAGDDVVALENATTDYRSCVVRCGQAGGVVG